eukprot:m.95485 g.95485  ORF g.95485 m.95485 type:complete len:284 (-) comp10109_c0_seq1:111-962(-)
MPVEGFTSKLPPNDDAAFTLLYFPLLAKGLGPALVAEFSGMKWKGPKSIGFEAKSWKEFKAAGESPFGQMPILEIDEIRMSQTTAIVNTIARKTGASLEGGPGHQFAVSQMLIAESEDLYNKMQKMVATQYVNQSKKGGPAVFDQFWSEVAPAELTKLEVLLGGQSGVANASRGLWVPGATAGELMLFAMLHQMVLVKSGCLDDTLRLRAFYSGLMGDERVKRVLSGESEFGELNQYFIEDPSMCDEAKSEGEKSDATSSSVPMALVSAALAVVATVALAMRK